MKYEIKHTIMPTLEVQLLSSEALYTQSGAMAWMSDGIEMATSGQGGFGRMLGRALSGQA